MVADVSLDVRARTSGAVETDDDNDDDKEWSAVVTPWSR